MEHRAVIAEGHGLGPAGQDQYDGTTIRDEGQRLVGRIEEEHSLHNNGEATRAGGVPSDTIGGTPPRRDQ